MSISAGGGLFILGFAWYNAGMITITTTEFGKVNGRKALLFHIGNERLGVCVTDFGAALARLYVSDGSGLRRNVVLGYGNASGYAAGTSGVGATVGRYAGRIGGARFTLGGREYLLEKNDGENHLHGGFGQRFWDAEITENGVRFTLLSPDGDEGFPGGLRISSCYELFGSMLRLTYEAQAEAPTVLNPTNHAYFNLAGGGDIGRHVLTLTPDTYAELDGANIPTGRLLPVHGTCFDFTSPRELGETVIDHSFIVKGDGLSEAARLYSPESGIALVCRTTRPTVHVYTADYLHLDAGAEFSKRGGVCLETQHLPDSPNKAEFPGTVLKPGEEYREMTEYTFSMEK